MLMFLTHSLWSILCFIDLITICFYVIFSNDTKEDIFVHQVKLILFYFVLTALGKNFMSDYMKTYSYLLHSTYV